MTVLHQNMLKQVSRAVLCFISSDLSSWGLISDDLLLVFSSCCLQKRQTAGTGERGLFTGGRGSHQPQIVSSCCSHCWLLICQTSSCIIHFINVKSITFFVLDSLSSLFHAAKWVYSFWLQISGCLLCKSLFFYEFALCYNRKCLYAGPSSRQEWCWRWVLFVCFLRDSYI